MKEQTGSGAAPLALANKISKWDYDKSVEKVRPLVKQWKKATIEILRELYLAKEFLTNQKGQYKDPTADNYLPLSWSGYCGEIGLSYQTANNWLRYFQYVPRELSETGRDTLLLLDAPPKEDTTAARALMEARVTEVLRNDLQRPADWTDREEAELNRQLKNAELAELAEKYNAPAITKAKDYFSDTLRRSKDIVNFKLESREQLMAQLAIFKYVEAYLETRKSIFKKGGLVIAPLSGVNTFFVAPLPLRTRCACSALSPKLGQLTKLISTTLKPLTTPKSAPGQRLTSPSRRVISPTKSLNKISN